MDLVQGIPPWRSLPHSCITREVYFADHQDTCSLWGDQSDGQSDECEDQSWLGGSHYLEDPRGGRALGAGTKDEYAQDAGEGWEEFVKRNIDFALVANYTIKAFESHHTSMQIFCLPLLYSCNFLLKCKGLEPKQICTILRVSEEEISSYFHIRSASTYIFPGTWFALCIVLASNNKRELQEHK